MKTPKNYEKIGKIGLKRIDKKCEVFKLKILLVDDEPGFLEQAKTFLKKKGNGLSVETATSGEEAFEMVEDKSYDAVVSDYKMPEMDGLELLKRIREKDIDILFYILTGRGDRETSQKALELGASGYFYKSPASNEKFDELYEMLMESIKKRQKISGHFVAWITITKWGEIKYEKFENALNILSEIMGFEISEIERKEVSSKRENIMAFTKNYYDIPIEEPEEAKKWKEIVTDWEGIIGAGFKTRKIQNRK